MPPSDTNVGNKYTHDAHQVHLSLYPTMKTKE